MRMFAAALAAAVAISSLYSHAHAAYVITIDEEHVPVTSNNPLGLNVVATGKGSLNLTGLSLGNENDFVHNDQIYGPSAFIDIGNPLFSTYVGASGPSTFGSSCGCGIAFASSETGAAVGVSDAASHLIGFDLPREIFVPRGYVSGTDLGSSSMVSIGETYNDLGLVPGAYVYSWSGDTLTVDIRKPFTIPSTVPLPASFPMFGAATLILAMVGYGMKRKKAASAA